jgi:hypothetical protein
VALRGTLDARTPSEHLSRHGQAQPGLI